MPFGCTNLTTTSAGPHRYALGPAIRNVRIRHSPLQMPTTPDNPYASPTSSVAEAELPLKSLSKRGKLIYWISIIPGSAIAFVGALIPLINFGFIDPLQALHCGRDPLTGEPTGYSEITGWILFGAHTGPKPGYLFLALLFAIIAICTSLIIRRLFNVWSRES